jgi:hypothetical protein
MTVTASPKDTRGKELDAKIVAATTAAATINASLSPVSRAYADQALAQAQQEAVIHYMNKGRISAATILSTLS